METFDTHRLLSMHVHIFMVCLLCFTVTIEAGNSKVSGIYVFGDSTVDPGNNNYMKTAFKSDFPPYGRDFPNQIPTGRFTNGKLGTDFIGTILLTIYISSLFFFASIEMLYMLLKRMQKLISFGPYSDVRSTFGIAYSFIFRREGVVATISGSKSQL